MPLLPVQRVFAVPQGGHEEPAAGGDGRQFVRGEATYDAVLRVLERGGDEVDVTIPDVGPHVFRYSESDRLETPRFWMEKLHREVSAFAHEVVRQASRFPQLVIARLVGGGLALKLHRKQGLMKMCFNLACNVLETSIAVVLPDAGR